MKICKGEISVIRLKEVDSTNIYAKANLQDFPDKTIIIADRQTNGHGRFSRAWVDLGDNNIFMSIVLKPETENSHNFANLTQYFSVVLAEILEEYGLSPKIKWPNDILINNKKIAGILAESVIQGNKFKGFILGVGINLNADKNSLSLIKDKEATALNIEINKSADKEEFLQKLLEKFFARYDELLIKGFNIIFDEYIKRTCFLDKEISVQVLDKKLSGIAKEINKFGELILENDNDKIVLTMGDIL